MSAIKIFSYTVANELTSVAFG